MVTEKKHCRHFCGDTENNPAVTSVGSNYRNKKPSYMILTK